MLIQLKILDYIVKFQANMIEKIWDLIGMHYLLQNKGRKLLNCLFYKHIFVDLNLNKLQIQSRTSIILHD